MGLFAVYFCSIYFFALFRLSLLYEFSTNYPRCLSVCLSVYECWGLWMHLSNYANNGNTYAIIFLHSQARSGKIPLTALPEASPKCSE